MKMKQWAVLWLFFIMAFTSCDDNGTNLTDEAPAFDPDDAIYLKSGAVTLTYSLRNLYVELASGSSLLRTERNWNENFIYSGDYDNFSFNAYHAHLTMTLDSLEFGIQNIEYYCHYTNEMERYTKRLSYNNIPLCDSVFHWRISSSDMSIDDLIMEYNEWNGYWSGEQWHSSATAIDTYALTDSTYIEVRMVFEY